MVLIPPFGMDFDKSTRRLYSVATSVVLHFCTQVQRRAGLVYSQRTHATGLPAMSPTQSPRCPDQVQRHATTSAVHTELEMARARRMLRVQLLITQYLTEWYKYSTRPKSGHQRLCRWLLGWSGFTFVESQSLSHSYSQHHGVRPFGMEASCRWGIGHQRAQADGMKKKKNNLKSQSVNVNVSAK